MKHFTNYAKEIVLIGLYTVIACAVMFSTGNTLESSDDSSFAWMGDQITKASMKSPPWDGPTDYTSDTCIDHPREALKTLLENWRNYLPFMKKDTQPTKANIGTEQNLLELADFLEKRIRLLKRWSEDESMWEDE